MEEMSRSAGLSVNPETSMWSRTHTCVSSVSDMPGSQTSYPKFDMFVDVVPNQLECVETSDDFQGPKLMLSKFKPDKDEVSDIMETLR